MANAFVQVAPDSTGKKMQTFENLVSGNTVEAEAVTLVRSSDNTEVGSSGQPLRVDPTGTTVQPVSGTVTGNQGTPNSLANKWPVQVTDGTNTMPTGDASARTIHTTVDNASIAVTGTVTANQGTANATPWNENVLQWGSVAVAAATAAGGDGTQVMPVVRKAGRRFGSTLTTTPLSSGQTFTGAWNDTVASGTSFVSIFANYDALQLASNNGLYLEQSDNTAQANSTSTVQTLQQANFATVGGPITKRYWRARFQVGTANQTVLNIVATESETIPLSVLSSGGAIGAAPAPIGTVQNPDFTNLGTTAACLVGPNGGAGGPLYVMPGVYSPTSANAGGNGNNYQAPRTPDTFKTATVAATATGNTAVWTPTSGKKFRLMRFQVTAQGLAATATAAVTVSFQDSSTGITIGTYDVDVPAVAGVTTGITNISCGWIDLGNGIRSAAANNVLNFNISAAGAGTVGTYRVNVCGTEE